MATEKRSANYFQAFREITFGDLNHVILQINTELRKIYALLYSRKSDSDTVKRLEKEIETLKTQINTLTKE